MAVAQGIARGFGADAEIKYLRSVPPTINHPEETRLPITAAQNLVRAAAVDDTAKVSLGAEDFAYLLEARPGAYTPW